MPMQYKKKEEKDALNFNKDLTNCKKSPGKRRWKMIQKKVLKKIKEEIKERYKEKNGSVSNNVYGYV